MFSDGDDSALKGSCGNIQRHFWPLQPGKGANGIWLVEDTDVTNHPVALRTVENYPASKMSTVPYRTRSRHGGNSANWPFCNGSDLSVFSGKEIQELHPEHWGHNRTLESAVTTAAKYSRALGGTTHLERIRCGRRRRNNGTRNPSL